MNQQNHSEEKATLTQKPSKYVFVNNIMEKALSAYSPAEIASIISNEQANMLKSVKGIGPKAAQRIIVELKDKISLDMTVGGQQTADSKMQTADNEVVKEAVAALTILGFSPAPTQKVVLQLVKDTPSLTVEQIIKQALKML